MVDMAEKMLLLQLTITFALVPTENDFLLATHEATFVSHTLIHNHIFVLCLVPTSELIRQCLNDKNKIYINKNKNQENSCQRYFRT